VQLLFEVVSLNLKIGIGFLEKRASLTAELRTVVNRLDEVSDGFAPH
jgi:hypothetical protein